MYDTPTALSRRTVLVSGLALGLMAAPALSGTHNPSTLGVLSGRLTHTSGQPLRHALVVVGAATTRTDGDGRFFLQARIPHKGNLAMLVRPSGQSQEFELEANIERSFLTTRLEANMALALSV
jgi:hypothetical protein